jgi:site-specific recombinase XerC
MQVLNRLTDSKSQLWLNTTLDTLTKKDNLDAQLKLFLISCRVNNLSPHSIRDYAQKIEPCIVFCRGYDITNPRQITVDIIRLYILSLQQRMKPVSVSDYYRVTKRFLNWLVEEGILDSNPMVRIRPPRVPKQTIQPFSEE